MYYVSFSFIVRLEQCEQVCRVCLVMTTSDERIEGIPSYFRYIFILYTHNTVRWVSTVPYRNWYDTIVPFTKIACTLYDNVRPSSDRCSPPHLSLVQPHVESRALDSHGLILP